MTFYTTRTLLAQCVRRETAEFFGSVLDVGCGFMPYRGVVEANDKATGYTGLDLEQPTYYADVEPDLKWDGATIPADNASFDCVMATEVLEHVAEPSVVLDEIGRVMRPEGRLLVTVPFIWNLHEVPHDHWRYTPYSLERIAANAGFTDITIKPLGGANAALAQMIGVWLGVTDAEGVGRRALRAAIFPFYKYLVTSDRTFDGFDGKRRSLFTGLSLTARR